MTDQRTLVVTCGPPGVGKTTVAEAVADRVDGVLHRTDVVRKDLFADPEYTAAETQSVYEELLDRGRQTVESGRDAVLDGTFFRRAFREAARETAAAAEPPVHCRLLKVECEPATVRKRIRARTDDESDADVAVYEMRREQFEPLDTPHTVVDNSGDVEATLGQVAEQF